MLLNRFPGILIHKTPMLQGGKTMLRYEQPGPKSPIGFRHSTKLSQRKDAMEDAHS